MPRSRMPIELITAVRPAVVGKYLGQLCLVVGVLTCFPVCVAAVSGEVWFAVSLGSVAVLLAGGGGIAARLPASPRVGRNEALVIAALAFITVAALMTVPFMSAGLAPLDALFESVSAVTTTGLSMMDRFEERSGAVLLTRAWMQWYAGLGFVVLSLALMEQSRLAAARLGAEEIESDRLTGGTTGYARRILAVYAGMTMLGLAALLSTGTEWFEALLHVLSAASTGGFSSHEDSLAGMEKEAAAAVVILMCLVSAFPLSNYFLVAEGSSGRRENQSAGPGVSQWVPGKEVSQWSRLRPLVRETVKRVLLDRQVHGVLLCGVVTSMILGALLNQLAGMSGVEAVWHGLLNGFSAQATAGFSTLNPGDLEAGARLVLIMSMLVGGSTGSTAGGFKMLRLLILVRAIHTLVVRTAIPPRAVYQPTVADRELSPQARDAALLSMALYVLVVVISWVPFVVAGHVPLDALFEVVSATATVGLSTGLASPELPAALKLVLCADMLLGRLEVLALLVLLWPRTWLGSVTLNSRHYARRRS